LPRFEIRASSSVLVQLVDIIFECDQTGLEMQHVSCRQFTEPAEDEGFVVGIARDPTCESRIAVTELTKFKVCSSR
jgi:hypothetical protein